MKPRNWQIEEGAQFFHCVSRVVDRRFVFGQDEREVFRSIMRKVEAFSGVEVLTWTILSNHFHLLLYVPERPGADLIPDEILLERVGKICDAEQVESLRWQLEQWSKPGFEEAKGKLREQYLCRMYDLGQFMKSLKQRFSLWFNHRHERKGTLWEERYRSTVVGGSLESIYTVAAYIDLNGVRAGLADDPKDYRWCGYAEAVAGSPQARNGLARVLEEYGHSDEGTTEGKMKASYDWRKVGAAYRRILYGIGEDRVDKRGFSPGKIREVLDRGGKLTLPELLRCRVRHFTDGAVIGTKTFVDAFFDNHRAWFGKKRKTGARPLARAGCKDLYSIRDIRVNPVEVPD